MARCKACDKKGLFLSVSKLGLCKTCEPAVTADIEKHSNVIYEEMHVFERAQGKDEKLRACDALLAAARHLETYEDKGLATCSPPAKLVLAEYQGFRDEIAKS
ncbi:MAG: hypothetical protein H6825_16630 [Planctomycetes bacterium]|nr:hypothetical protein [Planctomycetota bacterium]